MERTAVRLTAVLAVAVLSSACSGGEDESTASPAASATTQEPSGPDVPVGEGDGAVDVQVDGVVLPGDDWLVACSDAGGGLSAVGNAEPLSTVYLELTAGGEVASFVASAQDYGPFSTDVSGVGELVAEPTATGFDLSGTTGGGQEVAGSVTCPG